jgi:dTDP-4-dehydrorhamnose 3,5-epimerase
MLKSTSRFAIPGPVLVVPQRFGDARGFFMETYSARDFAGAGIDCVFVQDNHSLSAERGTVRGLHFQIPPFAQAKLVRVTRGSILDVAVDIRKGSPTFGQHIAVELNAQSGEQLFVPEGFAHGFCTLEPDTEMIYKVSNYYAPEHDAGLHWDDPALKIAWPGFAGAQVSAKDALLPPWAKCESPFEFDPADAAS